MSMTENEILTDEEIDEIEECISKGHLALKSNKWLAMLIQALRSSQERVKALEDKLAAETKALERAAEYLAGHVIIDCPPSGLRLCPPETDDNCIACWRRYFRGEK